MNHRFVLALDVMRRDLGFPLIVTSGYRCPDHNRAVGGKPDSRHLHGDAADIAASFHRANDLLEYAFGHPDGFVVRRFPGIGIDQKGDGRFIHLDFGPRRVWTY